MKRTRTENEFNTSDHVARRPLKRPRVRSPLASTRLAYHAGEWTAEHVRLRPTLSHTVSLLRPCAQQCTTWKDAVTAFARLGHGGSVVCKRGDGTTQFVGTVPTLRAWWTRYACSDDHQPVVIEENLWSRHPRSSVACLRYAYGDASVGGVDMDALSVLNRKSNVSMSSVMYKWTTVPPSHDSPTLRAIASATQTFVHTHRKELPAVGVLDLCWFVDDRTVYIVDSLPGSSPNPYKARLGT